MLILILTDRAIIDNVICLLYLTIIITLRSTTAAEISRVLYALYCSDKQKKCTVQITY
jgi:hypothetical protein